MNWNENSLRICKSKLNNKFGVYINDANTKCYFEPITFFKVTVACELKVC